MSLLTCPDDASSLTPRSRFSRRTAVRLVLSLAAVGAGVIHLSAAPEHLREWMPLGIGFLAAGALQIVWGAYVTVREPPRVLLLGGLLSAALIAVYLMSRATGLPLGPEALEPEPFGLADLLCCALEVPVALGAVLLSRRPTALRRPLGRAFSSGAAATFLLVGLATVLALSAPASAHQHATCPSTPALSGVLNSQGVDTGVTAYFACRLRHEHGGHSDE